MCDSYSHCNCPVPGSSPHAIISFCCDVDEDHSPDQRLFIISLLSVCAVEECLQLQHVIRFEDLRIVGPWKRSTFLC